MPAPRDPEKYAQWVAKIKAKAKGRACPWLKGKKQPPEVVAKRAATLKKVYADPERRARMSEMAKAGGYGKWMKGRRLPHISKANAKRAGKSYDELYGDRADEERAKRQAGNQLHWEGKPRKRPRPKHDDGPSKRWREAVYARDDWTCRQCGARGGVLRAHHVKPWATHPELRYVVDNGLTLCQGCHVRADRVSATYRGQRALYDIEVERIRLAVKEGRRQADIAKEHGVSRHVVSGIACGRTYKDV